MSTALDVEDLAGLTEMELGRTKNKPFKIKIFHSLFPSKISLLRKGMPPVGDKFLFSTVDYFIFLEFICFQFAELSQILLCRSYSFDAGSIERLHGLHALLASS